MSAPRRARANVFHVSHIAHARVCVRARDTHTHGSRPACDRNKSAQSAYRFLGVPAGSTSCSPARRATQQYARHLNIFIYMYLRTRRARIRASVHFMCPIATLCEINLTRARSRSARRHSCRHERRDGAATTQHSHPHRRHHRQTPATHTHTLKLTAERRLKPLSARPLIACCALPVPAHESVRPD